MAAQCFFEAHTSANLINNRVKGFVCLDLRQGLRKIKHSLKARITIGSFIYIYIVCLGICIFELNIGQYYNMLIFIKTLKYVRSHTQMYVGVSLLTVFRVWST